MSQACRAWPAPSELTARRPRQPQVAREGGDHAEDPHGRYRPGAQAQGAKSGGSRRARCLVVLGLGSQRLAQTHAPH